MKTLNLISTRWVLIMACTLIGIAALFTACEQQDLDKLTPEGKPKGNELPVITEFDLPDENTLDNRSYQLVSELTQTNRWLKDWNLLVDGNHPTLKNKDVKVEITTSAGVSFSSYLIPSWATFETGWVNANATTSREVLKSEIGNNTHPAFYTWSSDWTSYDIKVYIKNPGGGNPGGCNTTASFPQNFALGIDGGQPVDGANGNNLMGNTEFPGKTRYKLIEESGAKFVRINFFRPSGFKQNQYDNWLDDYDAIINHFHPNIPIYAVVTDVVGNDIPGHNNGSTDDYPTNEPWKQSPWIEAYVDAFEKIVQRFCGRIAVYESFNEPNVWRHGQQQPKMAETQFAQLLDETHKRLKPAGTNPYKITLVSGPLEAHDLYPRDPNGATYYGGGADYFREVLRIGRSSFSWGTNGYYPFDAIGYHIYVNQHVNGQGNNQVENSIDQSLNAIWNVTSNLPANKWKLYISEMGWNSELMGNRLNGNVTSVEEVQANFMMRAIKHIANSHSWRVKAVSFFSLMSFNNDEGPGLEDFGIARPQYYANTGYKEPCFCAFKKLAANPWNHWPVITGCNVSNY